VRVPAVRTGKRAVISVRRGARPRLRVLRSAATAAVVLCGLVACATTSGGGSPYGTGDPTLAASNPGGGTIDPFLTDGRAVLRALDTIAAHSGKPLRVTSMNADRTNGLTIHVQEPKKHVNVDEYVITPDGTLSGPTPVKVVSLDGRPITAAAVDLEAFDPKKIAFARLTQLAREAIAKSHFPDARVSQWELDGLGPDDRRYVYLDASRGRPVAAVNPDLRIVRMQF
jgi:hypothetical protein